MRGFAVLAGAVTTCPKSQLQAAPRISGVEPWTHASHCVRTSQPGIQVCVFTDAEFRSGQGISIITRHDTAARIVEEGLLDRAQYEVPDEPVAVKYEEIDRKGMGVGLFVKASEAIKAGEVVLVDYPTIVNGHVGDLLSAEIRQHLQWKGMLQLPKVARERSRNLAKSRNRFTDELENVLDTNAFTHNLGDSFHDVLFPEAARMNHACRPNVFTRTNATTFAMEVIALRDIQANEEILNSYLDASADFSSKERREGISGQWNFTCTCSICAGAGVAESDERRRKIRATKEGIQAAGPSAEGVLTLATKLMKLYEDEGMIMPRAANYWLAAIAANALGLEKQSVAFAASARKYCTILYGADSSFVKDVLELERDPAGHPSRPKA